MDQENMSPAELKRVLAFAKSNGFKFGDTTPEGCAPADESKSEPTKEKKRRLTQAELLTEKSAYEKKYEPESSTQWHLRRGLTDGDGRKRFARASKGGATMPRPMNLSLIIT